MSFTNLKALLAKADDIDVASGRAAYSAYHAVIHEFARHYGVAFERTLAAFVSLSPNSDYHGNLHSLSSVLRGHRDGLPLERITVSTYKHCRDRAMRYVTGEVDFLGTVKGPKIRAFFRNIRDPLDPEPVTIDGHMACAWRGVDDTMKNSAVGAIEYRVMSAALRRLARQEGMIGNQMQAILWLTRKRILKIKFDGQLDLFGGFGPSGIYVRPEDAPPYKLAPELVSA